MQARETLRGEKEVANTLARQSCVLSRRGLRKQDPPRTVWRNGFKHSDGQIWFLRDSLPMSNAGECRLRTEIGVEGGALARRIGPKKAENTCSLQAHIDGWKSLQWAEAAFCPLGL